MGDRPLRLFLGKWLRIVLGSATVAGMLALPAAAIATPHPVDADFGYAYNSDTQEVGFWFGPSDAEVACPWSDPLIEEPGSDAAEMFETECFVVNIAGPNGQINHGTIVSAFVHGVMDLIEISGYDGPRGHFISEVARGYDGKGNSGDHGSLAFAQEKKDSRGSKSSGIGSPGDTGGSEDDNDIDDIVADGASSDVESDAVGSGDDTNTNSDIDEIVADGASSDAESDAVDSGDDTNSDIDSGSDEKGKSENKGNADGNAKGSANANENAKGKGLSKDG